MNTTVMTVSGNLVSDVDFRTTGRGEAMARFRLACTASRYDRGSGRWVDGETAYWNVTAWRRAAENARDSLAKGHPVVLQARVRQRRVDREVPGSPGTRMPVTYTDLEALHFGLDLSRCRAAFQRAPLGPQTAPASEASAAPPDPSDPGERAAPGGGRAAGPEAPADGSAAPDAAGPGDSPPREESRPAA
jgi:single-strand DNA-binding protein